MTLSTHLQRTLPEANNKLESALSASHVASLQDIGSELVYTQEVSGRYLSFYWQEAERYGISAAEMAAGSEETIEPADPAAYRQRVRQIIESKVPERLSCKFRYKEHSFRFDLAISPILRPDGTATTVLVMGSPSHELEGNHSGHAPAKVTENGALSCNPQDYQKLLTQIARNIRRTLDLDTIRQQTVDGLGKALCVSRCIISGYKKSDPEVRVVAEYRQEQCPSLLGKTLAVKDDPCLTKALATLGTVVEEPQESCNQKSRLVVATYYKNEPNGLISLYQCGRSGWEPAEIELVREIAEQVGTAIAHATLYEELEEARQQAEESSRLKSEFLANTSHELRTPLNGMIGFLKLILEGMAEDPEEQQEFIQEAYRSALHLLNIINDILDIAKIEAGKMELELGSVKLKELFARVDDFARTQAQQKNLSLRFQLPAAHDEVIVYGNYQRLLQVMLNLVGNAIKFTHEGGVTITAEVQKKKLLFKDQELPGMVVVRVADTGIGVSLEKQDRLFQKFTQVDGGLNRKYGGTGLGLTISQKLVETMGGQVNFYSMGEGLGSTVTFTIPLYQEPLIVSSK
ncbi:GAF domain-containing sensor histidine kinase [Microseira wollei]|uniref:Circadian input-output histidine kinase CikA n=1 Tax=Microseira wollei NIES-4236 TaxID=2530354 RepID=A0AAV3XC35_9CYAN|nr:ATP-binding protein [Microseira wollei]GET37630.1 GAF sensor signal transduction histidine kinase [Microseira wollei NIES-4236]